jgi:hypothetical protein
MIANGQALKKLWKARRSLHLPLTDTIEQLDYSNHNYKKWDSAIRGMIKDLEEGADQG